jgi:hypothetical protein
VRAPTGVAGGAYRESDDLLPYTGWTMRTTPDTSAGFPEHRSYYLFESREPFP